MKKHFFIICLLLLLVSYSGIKILALDNIIINNSPTNPVQPQNNNRKNHNQQPDHPVKEKNQDQNNNQDPSQKRPVTNPVEYKNGTEIITQPQNKLVLVNKKRSLPADFRPQSLVIPNIPFSFTKELPKKKMQPIAAQAIEKLFNQASQEDIKLAGISAYRSYQRQTTIFNYKIRQRGEKIANKTSARPGESEHQTGLAIDISSPNVNYQLVTSFGETKAGKWLAKTAPQYGFIIRYPQEKTQITGYQYEPWHLRYVGTEHASKIANNNLTLEEYLVDRNKTNKKS